MTNTERNYRKWVRETFYATTGLRDAQFKVIEQQERLDKATLKVGEWGEKLKEEQSQFLKEVQDGCEEQKEDQPE